MHYTIRERLNDKKNEQDFEQQLRFGFNDWLRKQGCDLFVTFTYCNEQKDRYTRWKRKRYRDCVRTIADSGVFVTDYHKSGEIHYHGIHRARVEDEEIKKWQEVCSSGGNFCRFEKIDALSAAYDYTLSHHIKNMDYYLLEMED